MPGKVAWESHAVAIVRFTCQALAKSATFSAAKASGLHGKFQRVPGSSLFSTTLLAGWLWTHWEVVAAFRDNFRATLTDESRAGPALALLDRPGTRDTLLPLAVLGTVFERPLSRMAGEHPVAAWRRGRAARRAWRRRRRPPTRARARSDLTRVWRTGDSECVRAAAPTKCNEIVKELEIASPRGAFASTANRPSHTHFLSFDKEIQCIVHSTGPRRQCDVMRRGNRNRFNASHWSLAADKNFARTW